VPQLVKNGSGRSLILDCEYTLSPDEEAAGLVVKWFFNSQPAPVYQWIPGKKPQVKKGMRAAFSLRAILS
jgi:hypothetical protein